MSEGEPLVKVMLSFYGALLRDLRNTWWVNGTGMRVVHACSGQLDGA
jgi:hypothetical protein